MEARYTYTFVVIVRYSKRFADRVPCKTLQEALAWKAAMAGHAHKASIERYKPSQN